MIGRKSPRPLVIPSAARELLCSRGTACCARRVTKVTQPKVKK